jgi:hypothetical protein
VPLSVFLGRVVGEGEPLWLEDDQEWALALMEEDADRCRGCGEPRSETYATTTDARGRKVAAHLYEAERIECAGCRAISVASADDADLPHPHAQGYVVHKLT